MRDLRPHHAHGKLARERHVGREQAAATHERRVLEPPDALADHPALARRQPLFRSRRTQGAHLVHRFISASAARTARAIAP